ncbi:MAG: hypothetical protein K2Y71_14670 [Xanthobacteraceae bacterium]|nr:hypothetical protein [Xanthobacteraceae bacterium]
MSNETGEDRVVAVKAEQYRAEARRLQERAAITVDEQIKSALLRLARRWLDIAYDAERNGFDEASSARPYPNGAASRPD